MSEPMSSAPRDPSLRVYEPHEAPPPPPRELKNKPLDVALSDEEFTEAMRVARGEPEPEPKS